MPTKSGLLSTQEVAKITKLDASHIRTLTHLGRIKIAEKIGSMNFYSMTEVKRFQATPRKVGKPPGVNYDPEKAKKIQKSRAKKRAEAAAGGR